MDINEILAAQRRACEMSRKAKPALPNVTAGARSVAEILASQRTKAAHGEMPKQGKSESRPATTVGEIIDRQRAVAAQQKVVVGGGPSLGPEILKELTEKYKKFLDTIQSREDDGENDLKWENAVPTAPVEFTPAVPENKEVVVEPVTPGTNGITVGDEMGGSVGLVMRTRGRRRRQVSPQPTGEADEQSGS